MLKAVIWSARTGMCALAILTATALWPAVAQDIGKAVVVVSNVTGTVKAVSRQVVINDNVEQQEVIATAPDAATEIHFIDGTQIKLGPNAKVVLDKFVYDPDPSKGALVLTISEGVLRFTTGNMSHEDYKINTPNGTLGVRGTALNILVNNGETITQVLNGEVVGNSANGGLQIFTPGACFSINGNPGLASYFNSCSGDELNTINTLASLMDNILLNPTGGPPPPPPPPTFNLYLPPASPY